MTEVAELFGMQANTNEKIAEALEAFLLWMEELERKMDDLEARVKEFTP